MTPVEILTAARQQYNAVDDDFYSDAELLSYLYQASMELAKKTKCIRRVYTTNTVANQQEYAKPTNNIMIKEITYNSAKLMKLSKTEYDFMTGGNDVSTSTGTPGYYFEWGSSIFLYLIPDTVGELKIFSVNQPQLITTTSDMEVPERYHIETTSYLVHRMAAKDKNYDAAKFYLEGWRQTVTDAIKFEREALRGDSFATVQDTDLLPVTSIIGIV